jgi:hypothetical protein
VDAALSSLGLIEDNLPSAYRGFNMTEDNEGNGGITTAKLFLMRCGQSRTDAMSSAALMAICIRWARANNLPSFLASWDIICAARQMGFKVERFAPPSNLARIFIKRADVEKLRIATTKHETRALRDATG